MRVLVVGVEEWDWVVLQEYGGVKGWRVMDLEI